MSPILLLLTEMRGRLGMYLGSTSLTRLAAFLRGYDHALFKLGVGEEDPFLVEFREWVHCRYQTASQSWEDTILGRSASEGEAVERFWELLDIFLKEKDGTDEADGKRAAEGLRQTA